MRRAQAIDPHAWFVGLGGLLTLVASTALGTGCRDQQGGEPAAAGEFTVLPPVRDRKLDLLVVVDNSPEMAPKQRLLAEALPKFVAELTNPPCVDEAGRKVSQPDAPDLPCAKGARPMDPFVDVHLAVISSSLGGHGGQYCEKGATEYDVTQNDRAHALGSVREAGPETYKDLGFLAWNSPSESAQDPSALTDIEQAGASFADLVTLAGDTGCGFEAPLEAWYRFLIDPAPPESIGRDSLHRSIEQGQDDVLLAQRAAFLRPDSLLGILMLSDENDCSIMDTDYGWLVTSTEPMMRGTSTCNDNPNDPCCSYCGYAEARDGCPPIATDPNCATEPSAGDDPPALRCWDQKRRFGVDLLYPTSRYTVGLTSPSLCPDSTFGDADCECRRAREVGASCNPGESVVNPLYAGLDSDDDYYLARDPDDIALAGIIGVPWQDLALDPTADTAGPSALLDASAIDWSLILGDPEQFVRPKDALMIESTEPRLDSPEHPLLSCGLEDPDAAKPTSHPANGHEWLPTSDGVPVDLQYACIFPLPKEEQRDCAGQADGCPCGPDSAAQKNPLCQDAETGAYGTVQYFSGARPGLRELQVLQSMGDSAVVASVCPSSASAPDTGLGYAPAFDALFSKLRHKSQQRCMGRELTLTPDTTRTELRVFEALESDSCNCKSLEGRLEVSDKDLARGVRAKLTDDHVCDRTDKPACDDFCLCEIEQFAGSELKRCQSGQSAAAASDIAGFCYVADTSTQKIGAAQLLADCPEAGRHMLRFVGKNTPRKNAWLVVEEPKEPE